MSIVQTPVQRAPSRLLANAATRETGTRPRINGVSFCTLPGRIFPPVPQCSTRRPALAPRRRILHFLLLYTEITLAELHSILTSNKQSPSRVLDGK